MMKLSIIVPIYNVEQYLRKCVESLLAQDYSDYEIILVDDGSTDESGVICDEYAASSLSAAGTSPFSEADHSIIPIRVIHQANAGLSAARNAGIKCANGTYLCFVDSDDYWEPNVLGGLLEQIERDNLDVLRYRLQYVNPQYEVYNPYKTDPFKGNDYSEGPTDGITFLNSRMNTQCYAWQFIIKQSLLIMSECLTNERVSECLFTPGIYFEDTDWTPRMLAKAQRVASTDTIVYNYLMRQGSITKAIDRKKQQKVLDDKIRLIGEMQRQAKELNEQGKDSRWYQRMIADTVISITDIISVQFYDERVSYIKRLQQMEVLPIEYTSLKAILTNFSLPLMVWLLHLKYNN